LPKKERTGASDIDPEILKGIRLVLMDVDGVLTDGKIILSSDGVETKTFCARDGSGIKMLKRNGIECAVISGRHSGAVMLRAMELNIPYVYQRAHTKTKPFEELLSLAGVDEREVCFIGDDLIDIPILCRVGLAVCVSDASEEAKRAAHYVTRSAGGNGAVREMAELILRSQDKWNSVLAHYGCNRDDTADG